MYQNFFLPIISRKTMIICLVLSLVASLVMISSPHVTFAEDALVAEDDELPFFIGTADFDFSDDIYNLANFRFPYGLAIDEKENRLLIGDLQNHRIRQLNFEDFYVSNVAGQNIDLADRFGFPAGAHIDTEAEYAMFNRPRGIALADNGAIFVADTGNNSIRQIYQGAVYTIAGSGLPGYDNANGAEATFRNPSGIVIDSKGNIFVSDTLNHVIRMIDADGNVSTYAGDPEDTSIFYEPSGLAIDNKDVIYVADSGNQQIKKIVDGVVTTVAGKLTSKDEETGYRAGGYLDGLASEALFKFPRGLLVTEQGFIIVADAWNHTIRAITPDGIVYTVAGAGVSGFDWDDDYIVRFDAPSGLTMGLGYLFISDMYNNRVLALPAIRDYLRPLVDFSSLVAEDLPVVVDGIEVTFPDAKPFIGADNRTLVPIRFVAEKLGADVQWDGENRMFTVTKGDKVVEFWERDGDFIISEERSMVRLRTMVEKLGLFVEWIEEHRTILVESMHY